MATTDRLLILADDFTGACDAAGSFAGSLGQALVVYSRPTEWPAEQPEINVLGVDLDLRERSSDEAESITAQVARSLGSTRLFLKIDSTLRGPIRGLIAGALRGSDRQLAVIAPAFPEQGRLLHQGRVIVDDHAGASLSDKLWPEHVTLLDVSVARSADSLEVAAGQACARGARCLVVDADGVDCLRTVAAAWQRHRHDWLLVGSAGLARQVAGQVDRGRGPLALEGGGVLVVAGSPAPATQTQMAHLAMVGGRTVVSVGTPVARRPAKGSALVILCTAPALERDSGENARAVAETVARWAARATPGSPPAYRPGAVVLAGGATARLVCEHLGARGVYLEGELEPGIPFGRLAGGLWDGLRVVTKAGGFGRPETLLDVVHALGVSSLPQHP